MYLKRDCKIDVSSKTSNQPHAKNVYATFNCQVPYLFDPNTGVEMHESIDIRIYLDRVYTT